MLNRPNPIIEGCFVYRYTPHIGCFVMSRNNLYIIAAYSVFSSCEKSFIVAIRLSVI